MFATPEESSVDIASLYRRVWAHSDATVDALNLDALGHVPWWSKEIKPVTLHRVLVHVVAETHRHAESAEQPDEGLAALIDALLDVSDPDPAAYWAYLGAGVLEDSLGTALTAWGSSSPKGADGSRLGGMTRPACPLTTESVRRSRCSGRTSPTLGRCRSSSCRVASKGESAALGGAGRAVCGLFGSGRGHVVLAVMRRVRVPLPARSMRRR